MRLLLILIILSVASPYLSADPYIPSWQFTSIYDELWYSGPIYSNFGLDGEDCGLYGENRANNCVQLLPLPYVYQEPPILPAVDLVPPTVISQIPIEYPMSSVPEPKFTALLGLALAVVWGRQTKRRA